jgi:FAD-dependent urate hydroxylase
VAAATPMTGRRRATLPMTDHDVAVIGAGPYGLSAAAHLRSSGVNVCVFGQVMELWKSAMPEGMFLRSPLPASHIAHPKGLLSLTQYAREKGIELRHPTPREIFVRYGEWYQRHAVGHVDPRLVRAVDVAGDGFRLTLEDGDTTTVARVVVAAGPAAFAWKPPEFEGISPQLASHSSQHRSFASFAGREVIVFGGGQSALESAALLHESGATVEIVTRRQRVHWLHEDPEVGRRPLRRRLLYSRVGVGPPGLSLLVAKPDLLKQLPTGLRDDISRRALRPAGASWLRSRLSDVPITVGRSIAAAAAEDGHVRVRFDDGTERLANHALLATGYRVDLSRYGFLSSQLIASIRTSRGFPVLGEGLESSVRGLHFLGAPARGSLGPRMNFVMGTEYSAPSLLRSVLKQARR